MAQKAVLVLDHTPDDEAAKVLAQKVASQYSDDSQDTIIWVLDEEVPTWVNVGLADQLSAYKRDAGPEACFMTVIMCSDEEANEIFE